MRHWSRFLVTLMVTLAVIFGRSTAYAGPELGPLPGGAHVARNTALDAPRDMPMAREPIPPVPANYITKDLGWMTLAYPPNASERVESIIHDADGVKEQLVSAFGQKVLEHVTVRIAPTFADMARLAPADAPPPAYASGVAYNGLHLILLTMMAPRGADATDLDEVLRHELAHVALEDAVQGKRVPVWFNEGLAIWLSHEQASARMQALWSATLSDRLIPLADLDRSFPADPFEVNIAYAEAGDFMRFLLRKSDRVRFSSMIERVREGQSFESSMAEAYNADLRRLEFEWHHDLENKFSIIPVLAGGGLIWVAVVGMLVFAWARRRKRTKSILARWGREEAIEDARLAKLALEQEALLADEKDGIPPILTVTLKTEHDGNWHTLH